MKKLWNIITTLLVVCVILLAAIIAVPRVIGWRSFAVLSGSMEPTYHVGSLIYVKEVDPAELQVGDPITYVLNDDLTVVTHRIVEISEDGEYFKTKGDANDAEDPNPVYYKNIVGKPMFTIPYMGYFSSFISTTQGKIISVTVFIALVVLSLLPELFKEDKKETPTPKKEE